MQVKYLDSVEHDVKDWEVSHDGKYIAATDSKVIKIWTLANGRIHATIKKSSMIPYVISELGTWGVRFSPNSQLLVVSFTMLQPPKESEYDFSVYSSHWVYDLKTIQISYQFDSRIYERILDVEIYNPAINRNYGVMICEEGKYFVSWGTFDADQHFEVWSLETGKWLFESTFSWSGYVAVSSDKTFICVTTYQEFLSYRFNPEIKNHAYAEYEICQDNDLVGEQEDEATEIKFSCEKNEGLMRVNVIDSETKETHCIQTNLSEINALLLTKFEMAVVGDGRIELWSLESYEYQGIFYITNQSQYKITEKANSILVEHPTKSPMAIVFDPEKFGK